MKTAYLLNQTEYEEMKKALHNMKTLLDRYNPNPNMDAEHIQDLTSPVSLTAGALHNLEHHLMILSAQLGIFD